MATLPTDGGAAQLQAATLNREKVRLQRELHEMSTENTMLRRQNHQLSALLDAAVSKLEHLGHSVVPPFDIVSSFRSLRLEKESAAAVAGGTGGAWASEHEGSRGDGGGGGGQSSIHSRRLRLQCEIKAHRGAVLCARFSPTPGADVLATGSADCGIAISEYLATKTTWQRPMAHSNYVSDVCWTRDGRNLISASFDGSCRVWDVAGLREDAVSVFNARGYVMSCVSMPPSSQLAAYCCADSQRFVHVVDTRDAKGAVLSWQAEHRVTSLVADADPARVVAGDSQGFIRIWDTRALATSAQPSPAAFSGPPGNPAATPARLSGRSPVRPVVDTFAAAGQAATSSAAGGHQHSHQPALLLQHLNEDSGCSISHVAGAAGDDTDRLLVTSDDDMVRLYERQGVDTGAPRLKLRNLMTGLATRNYSIRASFRQGVRHRATGLFEDDRDAHQPANQRRLGERDLVAVGGNDNVVTVFDVTTPAESPVLQRLEGHKGRVYGAEFHPHQALLATYSADSTAKIWVPGKSGKP